MLKWLVTGKDQANSQIPQKKINKKKQAVSSEDPVAVIENYKYNITRVNPLFSENDQHDGGRTKRKQDNNHFPETYSSGYWSFNDAGGGRGGGQGPHHLTRVLVQNTELETCYSSTDTSIPSPVWPPRNSGDSGDRWFLRQEEKDRCFDIRHHQILQHQQQHQQQKTQQQQHPPNVNSREEEHCCQIQQRDLDSDNNDDDEGDDEYVLENDPENPNDNTDEVQDKSREDMNKVIAELTSAIVKSKAVSAMRSKTVNQVGSPRNKGNLEYNGRRRTLKCSKRALTARKKHHSFHNKAYLHDERIKTPRGAFQLDHFNPAFVASSDCRSQPSYHQPEPGVWHLTRKQRQAGLCGELDYKNYNYNYGLFLHDELQRNYLSQEWWNNYGDYLTTRRKKQRWCKTLCKSFCFVILLISFIVVVICVSVFIIKDKYKPS